MIKYSKYVNINSANPLHLISSKVNVYFEETNKNKHLTLLATNESKEKKIKNMKNFGVKSWRFYSISN